MPSLGPVEVRLVIEFPTPFGSGEVNSPDHPMIRPFRTLAREGSPPGHVNYVFMDSAGHPARVLGALCHTPGKRILFFPGTEGRVLHQWTDSRGRPQVSGRRRIIDHVTLEPNHETWHATFEDKRSGAKLVNPSRGRTLQVGDRVRYWFGLCIRHPSLLEVVPSRLSFTFHSPEADSQRRIDRIIAAREGSEFHVVRPHAEAPYIEGRFLLVHFLVGPLEWSDADRFVPFLPSGPPILRHSVRRVPPWNCRDHPVGIPTFESRVWICVSQWEGELADDVFLLYSAE